LHSVNVLVPCTQARLDLPLCVSECGCERSRHGTLVLGCHATSFELSPISIALASAVCSNQREKSSLSGGE
jgi:hypothetical protein